uniref:RUN domain-containing protein n=1 Tax=Macrostomum lignano TaxID=282301 RepID=A0A1I8FRZ2_9PLAT
PDDILPPRRPVAMATGIIAVGIIAADAIIADALSNVVFVAHIVIFVQHARRQLGRFQPSHLHRLIPSPSRLDRHTPPPPRADAVGAASRSFAAMPKQVDSGLGGGPSIESVYTNFLSISQRLSSLISEYYSGAAPLDFNGQQPPPPPPPPPPTRQLSLVASRSAAAAIYQGDDTPEEKSPNNPVALRSRDFSSSSSSGFSCRRLRDLCHRCRKYSSSQQQQQQQQQPELRASKKSEKKSLSLGIIIRRQQHRSESIAGGSGSNSKGGFGSRIRASLSKKFSPRQRHPQQDEQSAVAEEHLQQQQQKQHENFNQKKELASRPTATTTAAAASGAASSTVDYPRSNIGREAAVNEAASETKESSTTALAAAAAVSVGGRGESARQPVGLDSRVPLLFSDSQPADPCLAKLQRLRATVLDLVQRSVDPVLKSLRDIQSAGTGGGAKAAPQTAGAGVATEVSATLADVMSLMELLSRSVMLVSMHNLDPNSLKLASDLVASAGGTADEAAAGDAEDADRFFDFLQNGQQPRWTNTRENSSESGSKFISRRPRVNGSSPLSPPLPFIIISSKPSSRRSDWYWAGGWRPSPLPRRSFGLACCCCLDFGARGAAAAKVVFDQLHGLVVRDVAFEKEFHEWQSVLAERNLPVVVARVSESALVHRVLSQHLRVGRDRSVVHVFGLVPSLVKRGLSLLESIIFSQKTWHRACKPTFVFRMLLCDLKRVLPVPGLTRAAPELSESSANFIIALGRAKGELANWRRIFRAHFRHVPHVVRLSIFRLVD